MTSVFTSYKKTTGYKLFGKEWEPIHELNLYYGDLRYDESVLIRKVLHLGHKLSRPNCENREVYMLILNDLQTRIKVVEAERIELEELIRKSFDEVVQRKQFTLR